MDNTANGTRRQDHDTPRSPSPQNNMSNSTNILQSGPHRATTGPALQARPSHATLARKALSDEHLDNAAGASPASVSRRPTDNQTTARPAAASRGRPATTEQSDVKADARPRAGKVSTPILASYFRCDPSPLVLRYSLLSMWTTLETFLRITYLPPTHLAYLFQRKLDLRNARV